MKDFEISWYGPHLGEEPPISGSTNGSGTVFLCRCNLRCAYCQNWQISQGSLACKKVGPEELLKIFFLLEKKGCHNINLVSPVIWSSELRKVIKLAKSKGLKIPVVWNTNGYETVASLRKFEGIIDIYLPDYKYAEEDIAIKYSNAPGYPKLAAEAILEMQRQVGDLQMDGEGIAQKGLIVRHLVLPGRLENTRKCLEFIRSVSENVHLSLMSQYNPTYKASEFPEINRPLTRQEYDQVIKMVKDLDFKFGWIQEFDKSVKCLNPDFCRENPF
jgi:putative pyruvate formate lyase activating enzyme